MSSVPTVTIRNGLGHTAVVNEYDYSHGLGAMRSTYFGGDWEVVSTSSEGGKEGYELGKQHTNMVESLHKKRINQPLKSKR